MDGAAEAARLRQPFGAGQQHGGVAVVTAGVHDAGLLRAPGGLSQLGYRQRVHIRPQADGFARPGLQRADDAGARQSGRYL